MTERPESAEHLLALKDEIVVRWQQLPPEHQATFALVLVKDVVEGEWGEWMRDAMTRLWPKEQPSESLTPELPANYQSFPTNSVSKEDLIYHSPDHSDEIAAFDENTMKDIADKIGDGLSENYWIAMDVVLEQYFPDDDEDEEINEDDVDNEDLGLELLTDEIKAKLPPLYGNEKAGLNALAQVKYFTPDSNWTWYASEGSYVDEDGYIDTDKEKVDYLFFGLVSGLEVELGHFSLAELQEARGPLGLLIERDVHFKPKALKELKALHERGDIG